MNRRVHGELERLTTRIHMSFIAASDTVFLGSVCNMSQVFGDGCSHGFKANQLEFFKPVRESSKPNP